MSEANEADLERCVLLQEEEWQVLKSIYPDYYLSDRDQFAADRSIKLEVPVELGDGETRKVVLDLARSTDQIVPDAKTGAILTAGPSSSPGVDYIQRESLSLSTLPPILLNLNIPVDYPTHKPPFIVSIHSSYSWIPVSRLELLERRLLEMWNSGGEGQGILYEWIETIRSAEFLNDLGFIESDSIRIPHPAPALFSSQLTKFDKDVRSTRFSQTAYTCEICLTSIKGAKCIRLRCEHVFCRACLMEFWQLCILEGDVGRVGCPDPKCVKDGNLAEEEDIRRVVSTEQEVQRWKWLKEKKELEKDPTIIHCPLPFCQKPVKPPVVDEGPGWDRLRNCTGCGYCFCSFCRRTWHGAHTHCILAVTQAFVEQYMKLPEGHSGRLALERQYGKANLTRLVNKFEEEKANKELLALCATECPGCMVYVEKSMGCNHMKCARCSTHFCYLCGMKLRVTDPYAHYSHRGQPCYQKLFDGKTSGEDDDWWEHIE